MKTVKIAHPYIDATTLRQTPGGKGVWKDFEFKANDSSSTCDYFIVLNEVPEKIKIRARQDQTYIWTGEPYSIYKYNSDFLNQFNHVITTQQKIQHKGKILTQLGSTWFVEKSYDELISMKSFEKKHTISVVLSNKHYTEGHKKRFDFAMKLKDHFKDKIHLFGRGVRDFDSDPVISIDIDDFSKSK